MKKGVIKGFILILLVSIFSMLFLSLFVFAQTTNLLKQAADQNTDLAKKLYSDADSLNKGNPSQQDQISFWDNLLIAGVSQPSVQDSVWSRLTPESKKKLLKTVIEQRLSNKGFSYLHDFLGLSPEIQKDIVTNNLADLIPAIKGFEKGDIEDLFKKYNKEIASSFDNIFKGSDENSKAELMKLFAGEILKDTNGKIKLTNFLDSNSKTDLFNSLDPKTQEALAMKIAEYRFSFYKKFSDGTSSKLNSFKLEQGVKYKWDGNKLGIADEKGNLKVWLDFDKIPSWVTDVKLEKGILEMKLNTGRKITLNGGTVGLEGEPIRPNGKILGGSKRFFSVVNGIVSGGEQSQINIRYDKDGFVKISLSGNEQQTALVGKDLMGNDFWFTQFHQDDVGKDGKIIKDEQKAEILVAPNDNIAVKSAIVQGTFGRMVSSKTGFTEIGSSGLLGGDKMSNENINENMQNILGKAGQKTGEAIASLYNFASLSQGIKGNVAGTVKAADGASIPNAILNAIKEEGYRMAGSAVSVLSAVSDSSGSSETASSKIGFENRKEVESFFNVELTTKGLKITDEGKGYGVVDVTKSIFPVSEVKMRSDTLAKNEVLGGQVVGLKYLIDGDSMLRFGKENTYAERDVQGAVASISSIVNENRKDKNGNYVSLRLDNYKGNSDYSLYLNQNTPGLSSEQRVTDVVSFATLLSYGSSKGYSPVVDPLLETTMEFKAGEDIPSKITIENAFDAQSSSSFAWQTAMEKMGEHPFFARGWERGRGIRYRIVQRQLDKQLPGGIAEAREKSLSSVAEQLASNDPAGMILGEARTTIESTIGGYERDLGGGDQQKGREILTGYAQQLLANNGKTIKESYPLIGIFYDQKINLADDTKAGIDFYLNYNSEMAKFNEFAKSASLARLPSQGGSSLVIDTEKGTLESNGKTLYSPFLAKRIAENLAGPTGMAKLNIIRTDSGGVYQQPPSSISRVRIMNSRGTTSSTSSGTSSETGCFGGSCSGCSGGNCN